MTRSPTRERTAADRLLVAGRLARRGGFELGFDELAALPAEHQVGDVRVYSRQAFGRGVRLRAVIDLVEPRPEAHYVNVVANSGRFRASLFRAAVVELGIVVYAVDGRPIPLDRGGPYHLLLPGFNDACEYVLGLESLEFSTDPDRAERHDPLLTSELPPIAGAFYPPELVELDPAHPRTVIVPPRFEGEPRIPTPRDFKPH